MHFGDAVLIFERTRLGIKLVLDLIHRVAEGELVWQNGKATNVDFGRRR